MRTSSMQTFARVAVAGLLGLSGAAASARTLTLTVAHLRDAHAYAQALRVTLEERPDTGALRISADHLAIPQLGLAGRLDWSCPLQRDTAGALACTGPAHVQAGQGSDQSAEFAARIADNRIELALTRERSHVVLSLPFPGGAAVSASLQRVPAAWLKAPLAQIWPGGELREGFVDAQATLQADGRVEARYDAHDLTFNSLDGTLAGTRLAVAGRLELTRTAPAPHLVADATFSAGALQIGAVHVHLPEAPVEAHLDVDARDDGSWNIARFAWRDPQALEFEASGVLEPAALAPLRMLAVRDAHMHLPLGAERYARDLLAAYGLGTLTLKGDLAGDIDVAANGLQRIALQTGGLEIRDRAHGIVIDGVAGGLDWAVSGERAATAFGWKNARIGSVALAVLTSRWQSRDGALHLLGPLRTRGLGGDLELKQTVLWPLATGGERLSSAFAVRGIGYDSADGSLAAAHIAAEGRLHVSGKATETRVDLKATLHGGEALAGGVYVKLPPSPIAMAIDATFGRDRWRIESLDWNDPDVLELGASLEIEPAQAQPLRALQLVLRKARLKPALQRYAHSWLAARGYAELVAEGALSASLRMDASGVRQFAFAAHDVDVRDGDGRFAFGGVDGAIEWDLDADTPPTTLSWKEIDLFAIPLGAARARVETHDAAIVLAQPLAVDVLGGQLRVEKLNLQPRSPRGERYAGSFALVGIQMPQLSARLGWPRFGGSLSGGIPEIEFAGDRIELHGGLDLYVFDGHLGVSGMALERPFGVAPSLGADIHFENLDLDQVTSAFSFGGMSGRLMGTIGQLRLVDWNPVAFDAWLRTDGGGRMSYKAVDDLTSIGGGGGLSGSLQTMALKIFDTFGYRRLGIRCKLTDEICTMGGIEPVPATVAGADSSSGGYTIVEGSGVPRITIVGHRRRVDWPTLVRRLQEATQGQGPVIK